MQNSFEKQVRQKMDELQFVPTEPVWQNIEKQIRAKKDRKRFILWLPFLFLLLGGGIWWLTTQDQTKNAVAKTDEQEAIKQSSQAGSTHQKTSGKANDYKIETGNEKEQAPRKNADLQKDEPVSSSMSSASKTKKQREQFNSLSLSTQPLNETLFTAEKNTVAKEKLPEANNAANKTNTQSKDKNFQTALPPQTDSSLHKIPAKKDSVQYKVAEVKPDSTNSAITETPKKQKANASKWQLGVVANTGVSGHAKGFGSFGFGSFREEKALQDANAFPGNGVPPPVYDPSPVENNLSFSAGFMAKKGLTKRLSLSTGLQYNYYSTRIAVGQMRRQDTTIFTSGFSQSVSRFYLSSGSRFADYQNRYHFITIPLSVDWRVLKDIPLQVHAGLSVQRLISTNALVFDKGSGIYYADKNAFNKTQLFSSAGLSYAVIDRRNTSLLLGPQLQYGISDLEKNTSGKHLFSLGLTAQLLFNKN